MDQPLLLAHAHHRRGIVLVAVGALRRGAVAAAIGRRPRIFLLPAQTCVERHVFVCVCVCVCVVIVIDDDAAAAAAAADTAAR